MALVFFLFSPHAFADTSASLFFTPEEQAQIAEKNQKKNAPEQATTPNITLDAIMYYAPHDWTIWLQDERWTPDTPDHNGVHIVAVSSDNVHFTYDQGGNIIPVALHPHQSWDPRLKQIVDAAN